MAASAGQIHDPGAPGRRYTTLPAPVDLDRTIATHDSGPPADPFAGRDPERDFMLRYAMP